MVCRICRAEMSRVVNGKSGYRYVCHCRAWRAFMGVLEMARGRRGNGKEESRAGI